VAILSVVVVPARDEERHIGACLEALAGQTVTTSAFEVILVDDASTDATVGAARAKAAQHGLQLTILPGPGAGSGPARRLGMDAAAARLRELELPHGLIATTDADSVPAPDWLARQLAHVAEGAEVIAGLIELDEADAAALPPAVLRRRRADADRRLAEVIRVDGEAGHHHFAGASIGVVAEVYDRVGGMQPTPALEDETFATRLRMYGVPIVRAADVRVRTAARVDGRAKRGLSVDLAVSLWRERRRYTAAEFDIDRLERAKRACGQTVAVVIPAKECADTIAAVIRTTVQPARDAGLIDDVLVIDAGSTDGTAERAHAAGAHVLQEDDLLPEFGPALGKGDAMWRAVDATDADVIVFLDADTMDPDPAHLLGLLGPLLTDPKLTLVKGAFERPFAAGGRSLPHEGGRVTELMARPLLNLHFPLLAGFSQPLAGEFAARRTLLRRLAFPVGYGVEIAVLIDALQECGLDALGESHLGSRQNRHQPLRALSEMAFGVLAAAERRIDGGARSATGGQFLRPWEDGTVVRVPVTERPPLRSLRVHDMNGSHAAA
jgi:glucosyl-3-phosphoglycerate synthase